MMEESLAKLEILSFRECSEIHISELCTWFLLCNTHLWKVKGSKL